MPNQIPPERRPCVIIEFTKRGALRFLSHLDLARAMDRVVRRAKLPVLYSEGFNPHARISFAPPLPLGMEGWREPCLIDLARLAPTADMARALMRELPPGMELVSLELTSRGRRSPLADLQLAGYEVELLDPGQMEALSGAVDKLLAAAEWRLLRATKTKVTEVDLRPGILELAIIAAPSDPPSLQEGGQEVGETGGAVSHVPLLSAGGGRPTKLQRSRPGGGPGSEAARLRMTLSLTPETLVKPEEILRALADLAGLPAVTLGRIARTHLG